MFTFWLIWLNCCLFIHSSWVSHLVQRPDTLSSTKRPTAATAWIQLKWPPNPGLASIVVRLRVSYSFLSLEAVVSSLFGRFAHADIFVIANSHEWQTQWGASVPPTWYGPFPCSKWWLKRWRSLFWNPCTWYERPTWASDAADLIPWVDCTGITAVTLGLVHTAATVAITVASVKRSRKLAATVATGYCRSSQTPPKFGWSLRWGRKVVGEDWYAQGLCRRQTWW